MPSAMKSILYTCLLLLVFGLTACEKESHDYTAIDLPPEERFDHLKKPPVLFQFANRDLTTGQESGWIIDQEGWVRS